MSETSHFSQSDDHGGVYDRCDAAYLRQLHEASGMDETQLARIACLSVAQVRQLAAGGDSLFYSPAVKRQAYKRLLLILGAPPPSQVDDGAAQAAASVRQDAPPSQTIDDIVALSERHQYLEHRPMVDFARDLRLRVIQYRQPLSALVFLGVAVSLLVVNWPGNDGLTAQASQPAATFVATPKPESTKAVLMAPEPSKAETANTETAKPEPVKVDAPAPEKNNDKANDKASAPAAAVTAVNKVCAYRSDKFPEVVPSSATKEARYVYLVSPINTEVCVVDGARQATSLTLRAGEGRSVYGPAPWQVSGVDLGKLQIFFQGWRVALPEGAAQGVSLSEKSP